VSNHASGVVVRALNFEPDNARTVRRAGTGNRTLRRNRATPRPNQPLAPLGLRDGTGRNWCRWCGPRKWWPGRRSGHGLCCSPPMVSRPPRLSPSRTGGVTSDCDRVAGALRGVRDRQVGRGRL